MQIRKMLVSDAPAVATIHTLCWRSAYRGIMDQGYLDALDVTERETKWQRGIEFNNPPIIRFVAEDGGQVVAFICGMENRDPELLPLADCEIWAVYAHPDQTRRGAGRALVNHFKAELKAIGKKRMGVWCLEKNLMGMDFYRSQGGVLTSARKNIHIAGQSLTEVAFEFDL